MDRNKPAFTLADSGYVALRKESVDRNTLLGTPDTWDEPVALRKESVDRNLGDDPKINVRYGRSPQGERG